MDSSLSFSVFSALNITMPNFIFQAWLTHGRMTRDKSKVIIFIRAIPLPYKSRSETVETEKCAEVFRTFIAKFTNAPLELVIPKDEIRQ